MSEQKQDELIPFMLPNGIQVMLGHLRQKDYESLDNWVRQRYMSNVKSVTEGLPAYEKQEFLKVALTEASKMTFQFGEGQNILLSSTYGVCRMSYQTIRNPQMSFEEFHEMLFPEGFLNEQGVETMAEMTAALYGQGKSLDQMVAEKQERDREEEIDNAIVSLASDATSKISEVIKDFATRAQQPQETQQPLPPPKQKGKTKEKGKGGSSALF